MLFVTDDAGDLLLKSNGLRLPDMPELYHAIENAAGLCRIGGHSFYEKTVHLDGKRFHFFLDFDRLCVVYGVPAAGRAAEGLFDLRAFSAATAQKVAFKALFGEFLRTCPRDLRARIGYTALPSASVTVCIPPNAFALSLSLILRICRGKVCFSFAGEEHLTLFADGTPREAKDTLLCYALLREVCGVAGFALDFVRNGRSCAFTLELAPVDPALFGLKTAALFGYSRNFSVYTACFSEATDQDTY